MYTYKYNGTRRRVIFELSDKPWRNQKCTFQHELI